MSRYLVRLVSTGTRWEGQSFGNQYIYLYLKYELLLKCKDRLRRVIRSHTLRNELKNNKAVKSRIRVFLLLGVIRCFFEFYPYPDIMPFSIVVRGSFSTGLFV